MKQYLDALTYVLENGEQRKDRTGTGTISVFGDVNMKFDLQEGFPICTTKRVGLKSVLSELLWFIEGSSDERRLCEILHGTRDEAKKTIWTANYEKQGKDLGYTDGELGAVYGKNLRFWKSSDPEHPTGTVDQLAEVIDGIKADPFGRRHIISWWNPGMNHAAALPACHSFVQFYVHTNKSLSCKVYIRSNDLFLGNPYNITSYALFTHMLAQVCKLEVGTLHITIGDAHIYSNHLNQVHEQLKRVPQKLPQLIINKEITDINDFSMGDFSLDNYTPESSISGVMAV